MTGVPQLDMLDGDDEEEDDADRDDDDVSLVAVLGLTLDNGQHLPEKIDALSH